MSTRSSTRAGAIAGLAVAGAALAACSSGVGGGKLSRVSAPLCGDSTFPIYFQPNSDQLTLESAQVINHAATAVKGCSLGPLDVVGLAGAAEGPPEQAMELAKRRSLIVADALKTAGLPAPRFDLDAVGKEGAKTKGGKRVPLRRRAEVVIHAGAPSAPVAEKS